MKGIDTNILMRYLVEDDPLQTRSVERLLAASRVAGESVYVCCIVLCEAAWTMRAAYGQSKAVILGRIEAILESDVFQVEEHDAVRQAVESSRNGKGDFADYLIGLINLARGCRFTVTFDRALRSDSAFSAL